MKAYKVELLVVDFEDFGPDDIKTVLENSSVYYLTNVIKIVGKDIGEWSDVHPLNFIDKQEEEMKKLFG